MISPEEAILLQGRSSVKKQPLRHPVSDCPPSPPGGRPSLRKLLEERSQSNNEPFMSGNLKKCSGEQTKKEELWQDKYVEIEKGKLIWYKSRKNKKDRKPEKCVDLLDCSVSLQDDYVLRLEDKDNNVRLFFASSEVLAMKWLHAISRYCGFSIPTRQGYCEKKSGAKEKGFQERYLNLSGDGLLSWYKGENDSKRLGAIQVRGEKVDLVQDEDRMVFVNTKDRKYYLKFLDEEETSSWLNALQYHASKPRLSYTKINIRNNYSN